MKRILIIALALCLLLCGCGGNEETTETTTEATTAAPTTETTTEAATETTAAPTTETAGVTEPAAQYYNLLSGEPMEQEDNRRPFAIMINNHKAALPHCGISAAEVVYETQVEGGLTRYMAIFSDPTAAGAIGSVRSARPPYISIVQAYDAIYSSASGATEVLRTIYAADLDYINGTSYDGTYFTRSQERLRQGVAYEHTMFIDGEDFMTLAKEKKGFRVTRDESVTTYGFRFDDAVSYDGETANTIDIGFHSGGKYTTASYDAAEGVYNLYQYKQDYIDGNTGEKVDFRNVLILEGDSYYINSGKHVYMETVGEGPGYYARDGKIIPITWSRESEDAPYVYKTADGEELTMGVGKTYIALIEDGSPVEYE